MVCKDEVCYIGGWLNIYADRKWKLLLDIFRKAVLSSGLLPDSLVQAIESNAPKSSLIELPSNIGDVTEVDPKECSPCMAGVDSDKVQAVCDTFEALYQTGLYPAMSLSIRKNNELLLNRVVGHSKGNGPKESEQEAEKETIALDTPICLFSASKCITAVLMHWLIDQGLCRFESCIGDYLPDFSHSAIGKVTVSQLLDHRAGIPAFPEDVGLEALFDSKRLLRVLSQMQPDNREHRQSYHAITSGFILGALIEQQTQQSMTTLVRTLFQEPMGLKHFNYGLTGSCLTGADRVSFAQNYVTGTHLPFASNRYVQDLVGGTLEEVIALSNHPEFLKAVIPSGNFMATSQDLSAFFQMLMNQGVYQGQQILPTSMVKQMIQPAGKEAFDHRLKVPVHFKGGFIFGKNPLGYWGVNSKHAFGHLGFTNNLCWADPKKNLSVALLTTGNPLLGSYLWLLIKWVYQVSIL